MGEGRVLDCGLVRIYTRTGDDGTTGLLGPGRVPKSAPRVEAYGSVDELNAALGVARGLDRERWIDDVLGPIQTQLFHLGAELAATAPQMLATLDRMADAEVEALERWIDRFEADLPALSNFILPGGSPLGAQLHWSRTVCRRAERRLVALAETETLEPRLVRYLNRLGDLLFVMARWCNQRAGTPEMEWRTGKRA
jgi:cob(I)alamin adenosyltransferase